LLLLEAVAVVGMILVLAQPLVVVTVVVVQVDIGLLLEQVVVVHRLNLL
jgi:hypothetical protein